MQKNLEVLDAILFNRKANLRVIGNSNCENSRKIKYGFSFAKKEERARKFCNCISQIVLTQRIATLSANSIGE